jgi:hypothetical protein
MTLVKDASWDIGRSLFQGLLNLGLEYPKNPEDVYDLTTNSEDGSGPIIRFWIGRTD